MSDSQGVASSANLYTARMLGLATELARIPWDDSLPFQGGARSASCGSTLRLGLQTDSAGRIEQIGISAHACAVGQAAAAIFAAHAVGHNRADIAQADDEIAAWLADERDLPDWPGLEAIAAAKAYPARHGAIPLAWKAALAALPTGGNGS